MHSAQDHEAYGRRMLLQTTTTAGNGGTGAGTGMLAHTANRGSTTSGMVRSMALQILGTGCLGFAKTLMQLSCCFPTVPAHYGL